MEIKLSYKDIVIPYVVRYDAAAYCHSVFAKCVAMSPAN